MTESAGVDEFKAVPVVFGFCADSISCYAYLFMYNRDTAPNDPIEEGGFSYIGAADDGDDSIANLRFH
jgi:hypothetical protein